MTLSLLLQPEVTTTEPITVCAWCNGVRTIEGVWVRAGTAEVSGVVSHGICPECDAKIRAEWFEKVRAEAEGRAQ